MSNATTTDYSQYRKQLFEAFADLDDSARRVVSQAADVGLAVTVKNTPVGDYSKDLFVDTKNKNIKYASFMTKGGKRVTFRVKHVKVGGTLRKAWRKTPVHKVGSAYVSGYENNTHYALYVNNGHRILKTGVTVGAVGAIHMVEQGMSAAKRQTNQLFEREIARVKRKSGF